MYMQCDLLLPIGHRLMYTCKGGFQSKPQSSKIVSLEDFCFLFLF